MYPSALGQLAPSSSGHCRTSLTVNNQGWLKGYFETLGSISINKKDIEKNYGFWDIVTKQYVDELGKPLTSIPKMFADYGLGSYGSVSGAIKEIIDESPNLLRNVNNR